MPHLSLLLNGKLIEVLFFPSDPSFLLGYLALTFQGFQLAR